MSGYADHELVELRVPSNTELTLSDAPLKGKQKDSLQIRTHSSHDRDAYTLARLGKRQVLKVRPLYE